MQARSRFNAHTLFLCPEDITVPGHVVHSGSCFILPSGPGCSQVDASYPVYVKPILLACDSVLDKSPDVSSSGAWHKRG
jgi:hypothetical protein